MTVYKIIFMNICLKACVTHVPLLNVRLIVEILNFIALYGTDFGLLRQIIRCFCPQPSQICALCAKGSLFRFSQDEKRLRHVSRPKVLAHHDYLSKLHQECGMYCLNKSRYCKYCCICTNLLVKSILNLQLF